MIYPTAAIVESADHVQLARWFRFLKSPGWDAVGKPDFESVCSAETKIIDRIVQRFKSAGGMTPEISKRIGW